MPQITSKRVRQLLLVTGEAVDPDSLGEEVHLYGPDGQPIDLTPTDFPVDGTTGQVLAKQTDDDFDIAWIDPPVSLPLGGTDGQALTKQSAADLDVAWEGIPYELPVGGATDQVLAKNSATDRDVKWATPATGGGAPTIALDTWHFPGTPGEPTLHAGWAQHATSSFMMAYRKMPDGTVRMRGWLKVIAAWGYGNTLFTLPVGYRPPENRYFDVQFWDSDASYDIVRCYIVKTGEVQIAGPLAGTAPGGAVGSQATFDNIVFDTETVLAMQNSIAEPLDTVHLVGAPGEPAFQNSWTNFGGANPAAAFRKYPDGTVRIRGMVKTGASGTTVFTLPVGYRPLTDHAVVTLAATASGYLTVFTNGTVVLNNYLAGSAVSTWTYIDIAFDTELVTNYATGVLNGAVSLEPWHVVGAAGEPALQAGFGVSGSQPIQFRKYPDGKVLMRGFLSVPAAGGVAFTLPVGFRPPTDYVRFAGAANVTGAPVAQVYITASGQVTISGATGLAAVDVSCVNFDTDSVLYASSLTSQPMDPVHKIGDPGEPALLAGYTISDAARPPKFRKDPLGKVRLSGIISHAAGGSGFPIAFTLPVGYRPAQSLVAFPCSSSSSSGTNQVTIYNNGNVEVVGSLTYQFLDGIEFDTESVSAYSMGLISSPRVTSLPSNPVDGQECYFVADATAGVVWHLRYNAASASPYKWEVVGGSELSASVQTTAGELTTSTTYADITTPGPSIALPLAGDYDVTIAFTFYHSASGSGFMSFAIGGAAAVDTDAAAGTVLTSPGIQILRVMRKVRKTAIGAVTLTAKYRTLSGTLTVAGTANLGGTPREMRAMPVRVG